MFLKTIECRRFKKISAFRKLSMAIWKKPSDPSVYGQLEADATALLKYLEEEKRKPGHKITLTHLLIKALALALARFPEMNVLIRRNRLYLRDHVDLFIQVSIEEEGGSDLSGATVRDAHQKSLQQIAGDLVDQSQKIRIGEDPNLKESKKILNVLSPRLMKGMLRLFEGIAFDLNWNAKFLHLPPNPFGAAMITNVGVFGLEMGWAPLVPFSRTPMIMTVGTITEKPVAQNGAVVIKPILPLGFTIDHRIIDGFLAGKGAKYLKEIFENPEEHL